MEGWLGCMAAVEIGRGLLGRRFRHQSIPLNDMRLWRRRFLVGSCVSALGWGIAGVLLFPSGEVAYQLFLSMVVLGACAVTLPALAADLLCYLSFLALTGLPLVARLIAESSEIPLTAGIMACVGIALLARMAFGMHKRLVEQLNIRFAIADIAEELRTEMTVRRRAEEQLTQLANYDPLTGLANRTLCEHRLGRAIARARTGQAQLAVLFLDLDQFKTINDSLGHTIGDEVLKRVAQRLQRSVTERDTVARLSGDEFILLVEDAEDREELTALAERILRIIAKPMLLDETELRVTASIGITLLAEDSPDVKSQIGRAHV